MSHNMNYPQIAMMNQEQDASGNFDSVMLQQIKTVTPSLVEIRKHIAKDADTKIQLVKKQKEKHGMNNMLGGDLKAKEKNGKLNFYDVVE